MSRIDPHHLAWRNHCATAARHGPQPARFAALGVRQGCQAAARLA